MTLDKYEAAKKIQQARDLLRKASYGSVLTYLNNLKIDSAPEPALFRERAKPWQWALARKIAPAFEKVAGARPDYDGPTQFWLTLPRGHDKTTLIARLCNWSLAFSRRRLFGVAGAKDRSQATNLIQFMQDEAALNPWLKGLLYYKTYEAQGTLTGSRLKVLSADATSSMGQRPDFQVIDEITWWEKRDLWDTLYSASRKRSTKGQKGSGSVLIVITNAGVKYTWQWDLLEDAKKSKNWWVYEAEGQLDTWMDEEAIEEMRRGLPPGFAGRVIDNRWLDPSEGCGYITKAEADACVDLGLMPLLSGQMGREYVASIDYGAKKDRTACTIGHLTDDHDVVIDRMDVFQGSPRKPIKIETIEKWLEDAIPAFSLAAAVIDPHQMRGTIEKFQKKIPVIPFEPRGGKANYEMAQALRSMILNGQLRWYAGCGDVTLKDGRIHTLSDEIGELVIKEKQYGYRVDHLPNRHDDRAIAVGMMVHTLLARKKKRELYLGDWFL